MSSSPGPLGPAGPSHDELRAARLRAELDEDGTVLTVWLDLPERRNSQTPRTWHALAAIGRALPPEVRVVVLRGSGEVFSAGIDTRLLAPGGLEGEESVVELMRESTERALEAIDGYQQGFTWLADPGVVSVAVVQGFAIGAGFQLALACDLRVVASDARLCMKEPALGLVPDLAGTKALVETVGYSRALEICATARFVGAEEAGRLGIATVVVPREELDETTADLVGAVLVNSTGAVRETKALLQGAGGRDLEQQRLAEREAQVRRFTELAARG